MTKPKAPAPQYTPDAPVSVEFPAVAAFKRDLDGIRLVTPRLAESALASVGLALCETIDNPFEKGYAKAACAGQLLAVISMLRDLMPAANRGDFLSALERARADRRGSEED